jgi:hypothetical protein
MLIRILGRSAQTINKNTETLVLSSKEVGLQVNGDKNEYMVVVSRNQDAGRSNSIKTDNKSLESVENLKNKGKIPKNQNSIK